MAMATSFRIHLKAPHDEGFRASLFPLRAVWPVFAHGERGSDFNDLAALIGIDGVRDHLSSVLASARLT